MISLELGEGVLFDSVIYHIFSQFIFMDMICHRTCVELHVVVALVSHFLSCNGIIRDAGAVLWQGGEGKILEKGTQATTTM